MFVYIICALYAGAIFLLTRFLYRSRLRESAAVPNERWIDILAYTNWNQLKKTQLACTKFDRILAETVKLLRRRLCSVSVEPSNRKVEVREVSVSGANELILAESIPSLHEREHDSAIITALQSVDRSLDANVAVSSMALELTFTDQHVDALLDSFPRLRDTSELIICNEWDAPISQELLGKLCDQLAQLQHLEIFTYPADFDWTILQERWFLSVPKFSLWFAEVYRPVVPYEEAIIMQYLFDFSNLPESVTKYVDLSLMRVSDDFLRRVVERFLKTENRLTVFFHTSTGNAKPVLHADFEETALDLTRFRYDHVATRTTFISQAWWFFITNVPDENVNRHGQLQSYPALHSAYGKAFRRGDSFLSESFGLQAPPTTATTLAAEVASPRLVGKVTCKTSDQKKIDVDIEVLRLSHTFVDMYSDLKPGEEANFPGVDARVFKKINEWCTEHTGQPEPTLEHDPDTRERKWFVFNAYEKKFFDVPVEELETLVEAAAYLDIKSLYHYCCQAIAALIQDKTPEQIRALFGFEDDLTEERKDAIRAENPWCKY